MRRATSAPGSLWFDRSDPVPDDPLDDGRLDDVVVGAGLTGLTTALLLARGGRRVAVLDAGAVGSLTTGHSTAKVSLLQGTKLSRMMSRQSRDVVQAYLDGNREGQEWMRRFCQVHEVPFQTRDAVTYASSPEQVVTLERELRATRELGLATFLAGDLDVPFPQRGGLVLRDQMQIDPMHLLVALVGQLRAHGGTVHQGRRVTHVSWSGRRVVTLDDGAKLEADHVVIATGMPILDRGLYFAMMEPLRSYALAYEVVDELVPEGMYLSAGSPSRSIRDTPVAGSGRLLIVGGNGHPVGRTTSERAQVDDLREWTQRYFPGAQETHVWSAQDYRPFDAFPHVGTLPRGGGRIHVATGFDKWGMASGVMAARSIAGSILGRTPSWDDPMVRRRPRVAAAANVALINAKVGAAATRSAVAAQVRKAPAESSVEEGGVGRLRGLPTGRAPSDGPGSESCAVRAICTHLGGVLRWNDQEQTYDCPLHGSRFAADGTVIEGPATRDLRRTDE